MDTPIALEHGPRETENCRLTIMSIQGAEVRARQQKRMLASPVAVGASHRLLGRRFLSSQIAPRDAGRSLRGMLHAYNAPILCQTVFRKHTNFTAHIQQVTPHDTRYCSLLPGHQEDFGAPAPEDCFIHETRRAYAMHLLFYRRKTFLHPETNRLCAVPSILYLSMFIGSFILWVASLLPMCSNTYCPS